MAGNVTNNVGISVLNQSSSRPDMYSVSKAFKSIYLAVFVFVLAAFVNVFIGKYLDKNASDAQETRVLSLHLAQELAFSSDELTRLARTYVATQDPAYETQYWEILDIRGGKKPRVDGRTIPLKDLMKQAGFTDEEFSLLKKAEDNSNALVTTETIAMNAIKGRFADGSGGYTKVAAADPEMARRIMFDKKYHTDKAFIMGPISDFQKVLGTRLDGTVAKAHNQNEWLSSFFGGIFVLNTVYIILVAFKALSSVKTLGTLTEHLKLSAEGNQKTNSVLGNSARELSAASTEQAAAVQETVAAMSEMMSMIGQTSSHAKQNLNLANEVTKRTQDGKEIMEQMVGSMEAIDQASSHLQNMKGIIDEITSKTNVINDIVTKTQLLSFNASIEAARAGAHGRGFAVVAEEVGNLAQLSGSSAKEIQTLLNDSHKQVGDILTLTQQRVAEGRKVSSEASKAFFAISEAIEVILNSTRGIVDAAHEQELGVQQTAEAMKSLDQVTQQNTRAAQTIATAAAELNGQSNRILRIMNANRLLILGTDRKTKRKDYVEELLESANGSAEHTEWRAGNDSRDTEARKNADFSSETSGAKDDLLTADHSSFEPASEGYQGTEEVSSVRKAA